jgi:hypothetical protein
MAFISPARVRQAARDRRARVESDNFARFFLFAFMTEDPSMATRTAAKASTTATTKAKNPPKPAASAPAKKPATKAAKTGKVPKAAKTPKVEKPKKPKLVRDSFTMPKTEYAVLEALKERASKLGRPTKKSEVLRAGLQALAAMGDASFLASVGALPSAKPAA